MGARVRSWYVKAKDSAIGSSFDHHVVGGYRFLMRYYNPGDEIYFFGFSRGAYVARFLAEMLDYVGLLSHGNEEMVTFAWKAFSQWQSRQSDGSEESKAKRHEMYRFMKGFRETFSRPVTRIRFLGLFDTVNSVPRFEAAWMQRSKFPYTARSSAKVSRKAASEDGKSDVSGAVDNQDTGSDSDEQDIDEIWFSGGHGDVGGGWEVLEDSKSASHVPLAYMIREAMRAGLNFDPEKLVEMGVVGSLRDAYAFERANEREPENGGGPAPHIRIDVSGPSPSSSPPNASPDSDIGQVDWAHFRNTTGAGDGQQRDKEKYDYEGPNPNNNYDDDNEDCHSQNRNVKRSPSCSSFHQMLHRAHLARTHDSLTFSSGLGRGPVLSWKLMEYLPFRRMDLQADGSWRPIRWPLPRGEVRDIPHTARVHGSVLRRMRFDPSYRPGNLIVGGGGRGLRKAPPERGIGVWECVQDRGDPVGEVWVKKIGAPDGE
ncbi:hypothetical protein SLS62_003087 [Diatrype stigma]|uniref:T6SS Phospholipase effector Tle1-like catalytic domain-containing protein n=1 Tax=Diatrype stigma TaxID=117547 RepID=A0AAN9V7L2_9PEZI